MHPCLKLPEIVRYIIEYFNDASNRSDYPTLASLARTSRWLSEPALDALWQSQTGLGHLVKCMPSDVWEELPCPEDDWSYGTVISCKRPLRTTDLDRFKRHAARVRTFYHEKHRLRFPLWSARVLLSPDAIQALIDIQHFDGGILPNLQSLMWAASSEVDCKLLPLLPGPRLANVSVISHNDTDSNAILSAFDRLRSLQSPLRRLTLELQGGNLESRLSGCIAFFVNLEELTYTNSNLPPIQILVDLSSLPRLREFRSYAHSRSPQCAHSHLPDALHWLSMACRSSLEVLSITSKEEPVDENMMPLSLQPLVAFTRLQYLAIEVHCPVDLDDRIMSGLAMSWPHLECLYLLCYRMEPSYVPALTVKSIDCVLKHCPRLDRLALFVNTLDVGSSDAELSGVPNTKVTGLWLGDYAIGEPAKVAAFVSARFPNLLCMFGDDSRWREVEAFLPAWARLNRVHGRAESESSPDNVLFD